MNKSESKYYRTAAAMDEALISLLADKDFAYITVKEICEKAGVNRSTFYLHYDTIKNLLSESIDHMTERLWNKYDAEISGVDQIENCSLEDLLFITPKYLTPYLEFIRDNKEVYIAAHSQPLVLNADQPLERLFREVFDPVMNRFHYPENERKYTLRFYIHGMMGVINDWIQFGCTEEIGFISNLLMKCIIPNGAETLQSAFDDREPSDEQS